MADKQTHSHPILRRAPDQPATQPAQRPIVPVEEFPVNAPHYAASPMAAVRRSKAALEYADASILSDVQSRVARVLDRFTAKAVLFIGAECYDAPTITILQGLQELGFSIYTIGKPNVNSWFCNQVIESTVGLGVDFVLSNVQWGVRWSHYTRYHLDRFPKVLIDGCDDHGDLTWRQKIDRVRDRWKKRPAQDVLGQAVQPYQWGEDETSYSPDLIFASQLFDGYDAVYLPFGIQNDYLHMAEIGKTRERDIPYTYISGSGSARQRVESWLEDNPLPNQHLAANIRGETIVPTEIAQFVASDGGDPGIHSWFRWIHYLGYYRLLNRSSCLIYSNVWDGRHWWDSKRPWEALACGCLLMTEKPTVRMDSYPVTCMAPFAVFQSREELDDKARWLFQHSDQMVRMREDSARLAAEYFTPAPLARRFLLYVSEVL